MNQVLTAILLSATLASVPVLASEHIYDGANTSL
jgi:hypothetical protein